MPSRPAEPMLLSLKEPPETHTTAGPSRPVIPNRRLPPLGLESKQDDMSSHNSHFPQNPPRAARSNQDFVSGGPEPAGTNPKTKDPKNSPGSDDKKKTSQEPKTSEAEDAKATLPDHGELDKRPWALYVNILLLCAVIATCVTAIIFGIKWWVHREEENERLFKLDQERLESSLAAAATTSAALASSSSSPCVPPPDMHKDPVIYAREVRATLATDDDKTTGNWCGFGGESCSNEGQLEICCPSGSACGADSRASAGVYCCYSLHNGDNQCQSTDKANMPPPSCPQGMFQCEEEQGGACCLEGTICTNDRYVRVVDADTPGLERRPITSRLPRPDSSRITLTARKFAGIAAPSPMPGLPEHPLSIPQVPPAGASYSPSPTTLSTVTKIPPEEEQVQETPSGGNNSKPLQEMTKTTRNDETSALDALLPTDANAPQQQEDKPFIPETSAATPSQSWEDEATPPSVVPADGPEQENASWPLFSTDKLLVVLLCLVVVVF